MKQIRRNNAITHYRQLTREQLEHLMTIKHEDSEIMYLIRVFLYTNGLEMVNAIDGLADALDGRMDGEDLGDTLDMVNDVLDGKTIALKETTLRGGDKKSNGQLFFVDVEHLTVAARAGTEWLEKDHTLIALPFEKIKIGRHWYKVPDAMFINTSYQQYSNAQGYMVRYWEEMEKVRGESLEVKGERLEVRGERLEDMSAALERIMDARCGFMASMLCPYRWVVKPRMPFVFKEPMWTSDAEAEMMDDMHSAPAWLFEALYKQWEDNIVQFRRKFPELFHEVKTGGKNDAFVAELGTINLVISEGGYPNAAAVYEENVVFVLKLLNDKQKEYKEMEKINRKS